MAGALIGISSSLIRRISQPLSISSASWPAVAEHRKNGRMKIPA
jgi:hypothetical protein